LIPKQSLKHNNNYNRINSIFHQRDQKNGKEYWIEIEKPRLLSLLRANHPQPDPDKIKSKI